MLIQTDNPPPWLERFEAKIEPEPMSGCWLWTGGNQKYGAFSITTGQSEPAHRIAWKLQCGSIPAGMTIDHLCRNTRCVNPGHLRVVSYRENLLAGDTFNAVNAAKTHCPQGHPYSGWNLRLKSSGRGWVRRVCRTCERLLGGQAQQLRRQRRREVHPC